MAVPGSSGELQVPGFVCGTCGAVFHHLPDACLVCAGSVLPRGAGGAPALAHLENKRRRVLYRLVGAWLVILCGIVIFTARRDPTLGHAGRMVYPDEAALERVRHGETTEALVPGRTFRLMKSDRIEKVDGPGAAEPDEMWIRVISGPHSGRTGVLIW